MDYNEFSEKIKAKYPEYSNLDNKELAEKMVAKYPEYQNQVTFDIQETKQPEKQKGIDLTPSGIVNNVSGAVSDAVITPLEMVKNKETNPKKAYSNVARRRKEFEKENRNALTSIRDLGLDLYGYSKLPITKGGNAAANFVKNAVVQGGIPMAAEALKRGGNALGGLAGGSLLAAGIQTVPYVGRLVGKTSNIMPRLASKISQTEANTISQAIKPNSRALDLTKEQADRLALDTTERFRNDYNALVNKRGETVGNLLEELPEDKVFKAEQLLNNYDSILNNYSLSGNAAINPAKNATKRELAKIENLINSAKTKGEVTPKELYDINKNIDKLMINWDKPGAELKNNTLEQIYLSNSGKLSGLSPELKKANKAFSDVKDYVGKKSRLRNVLSDSRSLDNATSSLKNYKSTDDSIFELQKLLENEGNANYLNDIDDAVAALDLLKKEGTGLGGLAGLVKESTIIPALKAVRAYNRSNLPSKLTNIKEAVSPLAQRLLAPLAARSVAPLQYGGISYTEEN